MYCMISKHIKYISILIIQLSSIKLALNTCPKDVKEKKILVTNYLLIWTYQLQEYGHTRRNHSKPGISDRELLKVMYKNVHGIKYVTIVK